MASLLASFPYVADYLDTPEFHAQRSQMLADKAKHGRGPCEGTAAPDTRLHDLNGEPLEVLSLSKPGRPLVLNFGSCS